MKTILEMDAAKGRALIVAPEGLEERALLEEWGAGVEGRLFSIKVVKGGACLFQDIGTLKEVSGEPLNIHFGASDDRVRLISNLARAPFELDGRHYASVEGFWQGLKFPSQEARDRIAELSGMQAKRAGKAAPSSEAFVYGGRVVRTGSPQHWKLMFRACKAKFRQNEAARTALLGTGRRILVHRVRKDSVTIPGAIMADIWMRIRKALLRSSDSAI